MSNLTLGLILDMVNDVETGAILFCNFFFNKDDLAGNAQDNVERKEVFEAQRCSRAINLCSQPGQLNIWKIDPIVKTCIIQSDFEL